MTQGQTQVILQKVPRWALPDISSWWDSGDFSRAVLKESTVSTVVGRWFWSSTTMLPEISKRRSSFHISYIMQGEAMTASSSTTLSVRDFLPSPHGDRPLSVCEMLTVLVQSDMFCLLYSSKVCVSPFARPIFMCLLCWPFTLRDNILVALNIVKLVNWLLINRLPHIERHLPTFPITDAHNCARRSPFYNPWI